MTLRSAPRRPLVGLLISFLALTAACAAEPEAAFIPVRTDRRGELSETAKAGVLDTLARRDADPQHVVVLVHGFDTPVYRSNKEYGKIAGTVRQEFTRLGERVEVLGFQWPSDPGPRRKWLPGAFFNVLFSKAGVKGVVGNPYKEKVYRARATGRRGLRQLVMGLEDRFPQARVHLFVHSLGSEVALQAVDPYPTPKELKESPVYQEERHLNLDVVSLAGADLDQDIAAKRPDRVIGLPKLIWITIPEVGSGKDKVLGIRKQARGKAAAGNEVLKLRSRQIDGLVVNKRMILDTYEIPRNHRFLQYYGEGRVSRLAAAAATLRNPSSAKSAILKEMDEILALPKDVEAIRSHLASTEQTPRIYALWRLEHMLCGDADHLANGYSLNVSRMAFKNPASVERERKTTECEVVKAGYWPSDYFRKKIQARRAKH